MKIKNALYHAPLKKILLDTLIKRRVSNRVVGKFAESKLSRIIIRKFEKAYKIDRSLFIAPHKNGYRTLNEFFTRNYKDSIIHKAFPKPFDNNLHSPTECYLSLQTNINPESIVQAKSFTYSLKEFLGSEPSESFIGGTLIKLRLTPKEYHHAHYIDNGVITSFKDIKGNYYTSESASTRKVKKMYCKSHRHVMEIKTENFGNVYYIEVGATFVGTIIQNNKVGDTVKYGDKKSVFKFGGSTVFLLFEKGKLNLSENLHKLAETTNEMYISLGEIIGNKN
jgi:phosphatidylserine decarboxylase